MLLVRPIYKNNSVLLCVHVYVYLLGFSSDGEYNSMRNKGYTRPLSVLQIRSTIRAKYSRLSKKVMLEMLTTKRNSLGQVHVRFSLINFFYISVMANSLITCLKPSPFVSAQLLCEIHIWKEVLGLTWEDIISRLRPCTIPSGYKIHSWIPGNTSCT